jgi:hypothetical protein
MTVNGKKISTSLATFRIEKMGSKTKLVLVEQGAYFDEHPEAGNESRRRGTEFLIDQLVAVVSR